MGICVVKDAKCPCCGNDVTIKIEPAKWQGEKDRIIITHRKWQGNYK